MRLLPFLVALGACTPDETPPGLPDEPVDYTPAGRWAPGTGSFTTPGPDGVQLTVQVWFPSDEPAGTGISYDGLLDGAATEGLAPACDAARPTVVFSHGLGGVRWQSPFLVEHLASHGFVVIAPDHPGSGLFDTSFAGLPAVAKRRPADLAAAFDAVAGTEWAPCVDPAAGYAAVGHSFGGYTAFAAAGAEVNDPTGGGAPIHLDDPRVWGMVALAPWDASGALTDGTADVAVPALVLTGRQDATTPLPQVRGLWDPMTTTPRVFGVIDTAGHYSFAPAACLLEDSDGCGPGYVDEATFSALVRRSVAAFLAEQLGAPGADAQVAVEDELLVWEQE